MHHRYSSSVSPFQAYTGTPVFAMAAAAKSCVEKMLQLDHCTCARQEGLTEQQQTGLSLVNGSDANNDKGVTISLLE